MEVTYHLQKVSKLKIQIIQVQEPSPVGHRKH